MFILNGQFNNAKYMGFLSGILFVIMLVSTRVIIKKNNNSYRYFPIYIVTLMFLFIIFMINSYEKRSYKVGNISFTYPNEIGYVYGLKDKNNKYYYTQYYYDNCLIEIQKYRNNPNNSEFTNIKNNIKLSSKITETVTKEDIYNSEFKDGTKSINGKEWKTSNTKVDTLKYTVYYKVIDSNLYVIESSNFHNDSKKCTKRVNETLNSIKYKK